MRRIQALSLCLPRLDCTPGTECKHDLTVALHTRVCIHQVEVKRTAAASCAQPLTAAAASPARLPAAALVFLHTPSPSARIEKALSWGSYLHT
eukprot:4116807-Pleurochrysis_carterae.AAC.1